MDFLGYGKRPSTSKSCVVLYLCVFEVVGETQWWGASKDGSDSFSEVLHGFSEWSVLQFVPIIVILWSNYRMIKKHKNQPKFCIFDVVI